MCWDILSIWRTLVDPFSVSPSRYETHLGSSSSVALARRRIRRWAHHSNLDLIGHRVGVLYVDDLQNFFGPIECVSFFSKVVFFLDIRTRSPALIIVKKWVCRVRLCHHTDNSKQSIHFVCRWLWWGSIV